MSAPFHGGIHPADGKDLTRPVPPQRAAAPRHIILPLQQHIGRLCEPCVSVGEQVSWGQPVADGEGLAAPIHASVSGKVLAIENRRHPNGRHVPSIVIANDGLDTPWPSETPPADPASLDDDALIALIRRAGIIGMGGAAFPTDAKLRSAREKVDTLIINACECEPYLTADETLIVCRGQEVTDGAQLVGRLLRPRQIVLAMEDNKPRAAEAAQQLLRSRPDIRLQLLPTRYPQGSEKHLILAVTGREVPPGKLPMDAGCAVINAATCSAIARAVYLGEHLTSRIVTVTGDAVRQPRNLLVRIGTPMADVIAQCGGLSGDVWKVLAGGPMMGLAQRDLEAPIIKNTGALVCLSLRHRDEADHPACIRCGRCVRVCPMHLRPLYLHRFAHWGDSAALRRERLTDCIECGCCAYVCPGKLPLVETFRAAKQRPKEA